MRYIAILIIAAFMAPGIGNAQVYKCKVAGGKTAYSDLPCTDGAQGVVNTQANVLESDATRASARAELEGLPEIRPQPRHTAAPQIQAAPTARPVDQAACKNAMRDLDIAKSRMSLEVARGKHPGPTMSAVKMADVAVDRACQTNTTAARASAQPKTTPQPLQGGVPPPPQPEPTAPTSITGCANGWCNDTNGTPYSQSADGRFMHNSATGQTCSVAANGRSMVCH